METFGAAVRRLRSQRGLSLRALSARVKYDFSYLSQIERGVRQPSIDLVAAVDRALDAGGTLVAAHERRSGEVEMQRRNVLRALSALAVGASPTIGLEALRHRMDAAVGGSDLDEWRQILVDYGYAYYRLPPAALMDQLTTDLVVLQAMIDADSGSRRSGLTGIAAQLSVIVAMTLVAGGQILLARRWWHTARKAADESGEVEAQVVVRAWETVNGCYGYSNPADVLTVSDEAVHLSAGTATAATAGLHAGRAQAFALLGRNAEARIEVRRVADITDQLPATVIANVESLWGWPVHRLRHTESYVYTHIGDLTAAANAQEQALALYPASQVRLRAQVQLHRASCLIRSGHVSDGLRHAAELLDALPADQHNELLHGVARQVVAVVPPGTPRARVAELQARIPVVRA